MSEEKKSRRSIGICFLSILVIPLLISSGLGTAYYIYNEGNENAEIEHLKAQLEEIRPLKEKEDRIKHMEQTLLVHYKISKYEAHYYSIIIDDFSQKYDIPWQIYPAIIRIESNFDPTLLSNKGARGLTQVLESTGKEVSERLGIEWKPKNTLWSEIPNMVIGFTYLSEAIKEKGLEDGIRTYIGGPGFDKGSKLVGTYRTTVRWEFERLQYIHKGVISGGITEPEKRMILAEVADLSDE